MEDQIFYLIKYKVNYCENEKVKLFATYDEAVNWHKSYIEFENPNTKITYRYTTHFDIIALKLWK